MTERRKPKLTKKDRKIFRKNAKIGLREWEDMTPAQRQSALRKRRESRKPSWGFSGKSPNTVNRRRRPVRIEDY